MISFRVVKIANIRVRQWFWMQIPEELNFCSRRSVFKDERDMLGFNVRNAHVTRERLASDNDGYCLLKAQEPEKGLRSIDILHNDCQMIEMLHHLAPEAADPGLTVSWWHSSHVTASERTLNERMLPSVIGGQRHCSASSAAGRKSRLTSTTPGERFDCCAEDCGPSSKKYERQERNQNCLQHLSAPHSRRPFFVS